MVLIALGVLVLAGLVALGRGSLIRGGKARAASLAFAAAALAAAAYDAARGGWLGGSILATAALWLATSSRPPRAPPPERMGRAEAASMLGVAPDAPAAEIEAAYRRLIRRVHPDAGGAAGLAAQLNTARDRLLGGR